MSKRSYGGPSLKLIAPMVSSVSPRLAGAFLSGRGRFRLQQASDEQAGLVAPLTPNGFETQVLDQIVVNLAVPNNLPLAAVAVAVDPSAPEQAARASAPVSAVAVTVRRVASTWAARVE